MSILSDSLERASMNRDNRGMLLEKQLVLVSPFDPNAGFHVGNAMQRNKLIYALADAALVVNSDLNKGGTWTGAIEQLQKLHFVPVYVRSTGEASKGLQELVQNGALPWPNPEDSAELLATMREHAPADGVSVRDELLLLSNGDDGSSSLDSAAAPAGLPDLRTPDGAAALAPADKPFAEVRERLVRLLESPKSQAQVCEELQVTRAQARELLKRLVEDGTLVRQRRSATFVVKPAGLFEFSSSE